MKFIINIKFLFKTYYLLILFIGFLFLTSFTDMDQVEDSEEITIKLSDGNILSGTLNNPKKANKNVLIILVSPPKSINRDLSYSQSYSLHSQPYASYGIFRSMAETLAKEGISVFRFDNRGYGKSTGKSLSPTLFDHAKDVEEVVGYFSKHGKYRKIGLSGFSEGAATATVVASRSRHVKFLVLLSAPSFGGWEFWKYQILTGFKKLSSRYPDTSILTSVRNETIRTQAKLFDTLNKYNDTVQLRRSFEKYFDVNHLKGKVPSVNEKPLYNPYLAIWLTPHQITLRKFQPEKYLLKVKCPILAIYGKEDDRLDASANLARTDYLLSKIGNKKSTKILIDSLNHSLQSLDATNPKSVKINPKISNKVLSCISAWLMKL